MNERKPDQRKQQQGQQGQQQQQQQGGTRREDEPIIGRDERDLNQEEADLGDVEFESDMDDDATSRTGEESVGR